MYEQRLPSEQQIKRLGGLVRAYPATRSDLVRTARLWNLPSEVVGFLKQVPSDFEFKSPKDVLFVAKSLAAQIRSDWEAPSQRRLTF